MTKSFDSKKANGEEVFEGLDSEKNGSSSSHSRDGFFFMFKALPNGIFAVSLFGLFLGISTTMVYSQLSLFLRNELHVSAASIAFIDGIVEFLAYVVRVFSGFISDYLCERKLILIVGCSVTLAARPLLALANSSLMVVLIQSMERIGNGLQATPRDALIADISHIKDRGKSFGFSRSLKTIGAFLGTPIAIGIMWLTSDNYRVVFLCAVIPVIIAIFCLLMVKNPRDVKNGVAKNAEKIKPENPFKRKYLKSLDITFWKILILAVVFDLGHFSEHLLPIYANNFLSTTFSGIVSMFISVGQVLCSFPIGFYADKFGKGKFIKVCILMMIAANLFFISAMYTKDYPVVLMYMGAFLWGGQMTAIQGVFLSVISEQVNFHLRATAMGIYYCAIGGAYFLASMIGGKIWTIYGSTYAFLYSMFFCCLSFCLLAVLLPDKYKNALIKSK